jgi:hypothetical protein
LGGDRQQKGETDNIGVGGMAEGWDRQQKGETDNIEVRQTTEL